MKLTKRLLSLVLALAMVCAILPVGLTASAEETAPVTEDIQIPEQTETADTKTSAVDAQIPTVTEKSEITPWVNPLYEGVIDESALKPHVPNADPDASVQATYGPASTAGIMLRSYLKARTETVTLYASDESNNYGVVLQKILEVAVEHTGIPQEGDYLNWQVAGFEGTYERKYVNSMYDYTFSLTFTYMTTVAQENELAVAVSAQINSLGIRHKTPYEKISAVYQYMCDNITYDYDHLDDPDYLLQFSAYGAMVNKTAVCQGYALLFYRFMLELNVDCRVIVGLGGDAENNGPHAWNIVEINNLYYNVDTTWDAGYDEYVWFLNNTWNFIYHYRDMEYDTIDFHNAYPMAAEDYDPDVKAEMDPYIIGGPCGDEAIWLLGRDACVTIAGNGAMYDYPYSASPQFLAPWRYWEDEITAVVVEEGITEIGEYTFCCEDSLTSVTLPDTLEVIRMGAFSYCSSLEQITIPDSVTTIVGSAFRESGLTSIVIPDSVTDYDVDFHYCHNLESVVLGAGITTVHTQAFYECRSLTSVTFRGEITAIGSGAFKDCRSLTTFTIPDTVTVIGGDAFSQCYSLTSITIPASVTSIGMHAFWQCTKLEEVIFEGGPYLDRYIFEATYGSIKAIRFLGEVPTFHPYAFDNITTTAYYPVDVPGWTEDVMQDYGGNITWVASAHAHKYEPVVTEPTCTEQGYTTYTCLYCVESYVADYTDPTGHTPGEVHVENEVPATCTEKGSYDNVTLCAVCGEECGLETIIVDEIPHTPGEVQVENEVAATCTAKGSYDNVTYCTVCGAEASRETVETETIPHTYSPVVTDPTCDEQGYTTHTCTVCGNSYVDNYVSALGHTYDNYTLTTKPTQTQTGTLTGTCTVCSGTTNVVLPMLNEEDYTYVVTLEPTDDEHGAATYTWNITDYGTITIEVRLRKLSGLPTGDLNDDGNVDIFDANLIIAYYNGTAELDDDQLDAADVNGNGEVDIFDANLVVSYYNGTIDVFPADE